MSKSYLTIEDFELDSARGSGGVTGSKTVEAKNGDSYQLKPSILSRNVASIRRNKANNTDRENFGEVIAATVGRAVMRSDEADVTELVPKLSLVYDKNQNKVLVASKFLPNVVQPSLDKYAQEIRGVSITKRHVKVSDKSAGNGILDISGDNTVNKVLRQDLGHAIALSVLVGDHDVNPGNMIVIRDNKDQHRIARIDFGHAQNDLLNTKKIFGGRVRNQGNQVLDFLNREKLAGFPRGAKTKLWRDYDVVPSQELADALKNISKSTEISKGVNAAKQQYQDLINDLDPKNKNDQKTLFHIKKSLAAISNNVSDKADKVNPKADVKYVLDKSFKNLENFYTRQQEHMQDVAKLMDLQVKCDQLITDKQHLRTTDSKVIEAIYTQYEELQNAPGIMQKAGGIEWVKTEAKTPSFKGTLDSYLGHRASQLEEQKAKQSEEQKAKQSRQELFRKERSGAIIDTTVELDKIRQELGVGIIHETLNENSVLATKGHSSKIKNEGKKGAGISR